MSNRSKVKDSSQYLDNISWDDQNNLPMQEIVSSPDGGVTINRLQVGPNGGMYTTSVPLATRLDGATTTSVTYVGKAVIATATSAAAWQIFKIDQTVASTMAITWAGGSANFSNIWDNRASLSYS